MHALVLSVTDINIAMTKSLPPLLMLSASGTVPTSGWSGEELVPSVYFVEPDDGIWDFHFMAERPKGIVLQQISRIEGNITVELPQWCRGVRIHSANNKLEQLFSDDTYVMDNLPTRDPGDAWPWLISKETIRAADELSQAQLTRSDDRGNDELKRESLIGMKLRVLQKGQQGDLMLGPNRVTFLLDEHGIIKNWGFY